MATALGARALTAPLPTGLSPGAVHSKRGGGSAAVAWPPAENFMYPGDGTGGDLGPFNRPERFWLRCGATNIARCIQAAWTRYDYQIRLVVNGSYGNDLNGINFFQKCTADTNQADGWWGYSIEALFYCEANVNYVPYFLSKGGGASCQYYQYSLHYNFWAYTIGEGVY